ncbi:hypothetical protein GO988_11320 [Hymenobacter sp. HMF4947]|uniref:Uncharacterized protein n=1 Tax=Hymenobacter ginkgonis TaxID=2682976 RepID=A0A7K1TET9_9BACT|nr:hypothetical protein [Hymenobacter ginkgonis]MVN76914.1 hypothetical protein [Hymenobacter ginkgonis]
MSLHLITIDQLMQLDPKTLKYALGMFQKELDGTLAFLAETPEARKDEQVLTDLDHLLTLRKVFKLRIEELEAEQAEQPAMGVSQSALAAA